MPYFIKETVTSNRIILSYSNQLNLHLSFTNKFILSNSVNLACLSLLAYEGKNSLTDFFSNELSDSARKPFSTQPGQTRTKKE
jgi:hypothetical protein